MNVTMSQLQLVDGAGDLKRRWRDFRAGRPQTRVRDAARALGVSEAELVATQVGETATRLAGNFAADAGTLHGADPQRAGGQ